MPTVDWKEDSVDGWVSADEWLKAYNRMEMEELDKRRYIEYMLEQEWSPSARPGDPDFGRERS